MRLTPNHIEAVFGRFLSAQCAGDDPDTSYIFYHTAKVIESISAIQRLFPDDTLHTVAVKACPLPAILTEACAAGAGAETASLAELKLALHVGFSPDRIVFDSPAKTRAEIKFALQTGVHINADNFEELNRIAAIYRTHAAGCTVGLRINPQVGTGRIAGSSTAGDYSKFGIPVIECRSDILQAFQTHSYLTGLHIHIGSQGCPLELLVAGIERAVDFIDDINTKLEPLGRRVELFDIGGGLPVAYRDDDKPPGMEAYRDAIDRVLQKIDGPPPRLITEFGRHIFANAGWTASRVEYVKRHKSMATAVIHVGADLFLRRCYRPEDWHHDIFIVDKTGRMKTGKDTVPYTIAGPLCFSGDVLATGISLPPIEEGDFVIIRDTGAYTLSMWSRYNSRCMPKVVGYDSDKNFVTLKDRESPDDLITFWS